MNIDRELKLDMTVAELLTLLKPIVNEKGYQPDGQPLHYTGRLDDTGGTIRNTAMKHFDLYQPIELRISKMSDNETRLHIRTSIKTLPSNARGIMTSFLVPMLVMLLLTLLIEENLTAFILLKTVFIGLLVSVILNFFYFKMYKIRSRSLGDLDYLLQYIEEHLSSGKSA